MVYSPDIVRAIDWVKVLKLLGVEPTTTSLPSCAPCVFCGGRMWLYYDDSNRTQWFQCSGCYAHGSTVELLAAASNVSVQAAVGKLFAAGLYSLPSAVTEQAEMPRVLRTIAMRQGHEKTWEAWQQRLTSNDSMALRRMQQRLHVARDLTPDRWRAGPGRFVGGATVSEIYTCCGSGGRTPLFAGDNAQYKGDTLAIPFHDVPGKLRGFLFLLNPEGGVLEYRAVSRALAYSHYDSGVAMFDAAYARRHDFCRGAVFVLSDPVLALQLHSYHAQEHQDTLPIVSTFCGGNFSTYPEALGGVTSDRVVFWSAAGDRAQMYRNAKVVNGLVAQHPWPKNKRALQHRAVPALLRDLSDSAVPWRTALADELHDPGVNGADLLYRIGMDYEELTRFFTDFAPDLYAEYVTSLGRRWPEKRITVNDTDVLECEDGWVCADNKHVILNAIIRVEKIAQYRDEQMTYVGHILYRDKVIPFQWLSTKFEVSPGVLVRKAMVAHKVFPVIDDTWSRQLMNIAVRFHQPVVRRAFNRMGWCAEEGRFVFHDYAVGVGGDVTDEVTLVERTRRNWATPAWSLSRPDAFASADMELLQRDDKLLGVLWALVGTLVHNVVAPAVNKKPYGVCLRYVRGDGVLKEMLQLLGCVTRSVKNCDDHNWPALVLHGRCKQWAHKTFNVWLHKGPRNAFVLATGAHADSMGVSNTWSIVDADNNEELPESWRAVLPKIVPSLVQFIAARRFDLGTGHLGKAVTDELAAWCKAHGGDPGRVRAGLTQVDWYPRSVKSRAKRAVAYLLRLMTYCVAESLVVVTEHGRKGWRVVVDRGDGYLFPKALLNNALVCRSTFGNVEIDLIDRYIEHQDEVTEVLVDKTKCWHITKPVWDKYLHEQERLYQVKRENPRHGHGQSRRREEPNG